MSNAGDPPCSVASLQATSECGAVKHAGQFTTGLQVLAIPEFNSLRVPEGSSVEVWTQDWLLPFQQWHGALPPALVAFIADLQQPALFRQAGLILYIHKHAKGSLWQSWLALLPPLAAATFPGGPWSAKEIEELQLQPLKALMTANCHYFRSQAEELFRLLAEGPQGLAGLRELRLADTELVKELQQRQRLLLQQLQQKLASGSVPTAVPVLEAGKPSSARLLVAVAARLERKLLLQLCSELLVNVQSLLVD
eukprot:gene7651-7854_t